MTKPALVCVLGATGAGKTEAAILAAQAVRGEVVNFDSRQVYRDLPLVTAQPSAEEKSRCPHHLYGFATLTDTFGAGEYARLLEKAVAEVLARGRVPILTGGTGLYLRAFLEGLAAIPKIAEKFRRQAAALYDASGARAAHAELSRVDPAYAARIAPADRQRVTRALEVFFATGRAFSDWHKSPQGAPGRGYRVVKTGMALPLDALSPRLEARIMAMLAAGARDEVRRALATCPDERAPGLSGIGCPELAAHLRGELDLEQTVALWLKNTRAYAKRQITWFKKERGVAWFSPDRPGELAAYAKSALDRTGEDHGETP